MLVHKQIHKSVKKYFIPHHENEFRPHIFRELSVAIILGSILLLFVLSVSTKRFLSGTVLGANISTSVLIDMTNETRLAMSETPLTRNTMLDTAAGLVQARRRRAEDLAPP